MSLKSNAAEAQKELKVMKKNLRCIVPVDDEVYSATIVAFNSDGTFRIDYGDGNLLTDDSITPNSIHPPFQVTLLTSRLTRSSRLFPRLP